MTKPKSQARKRKAPKVEKEATAAKGKAKRTKKEEEEEEDDVEKDQTEEEVEEVEVEKNKAESGKAEKADDTAKEDNNAKSDTASNTAAGNDNGKDFNVKIVSWNINGIRAWVDHGGMDYVKNEAPDIFCCQETKCDKLKIPPKAGLKGYESYWLSGDKDGYSGVGLLTKIKPIKVSYGINDKKFDTEGRVITAEYDNFILVNTYIPNASRGLVRLPFRMEWEKAFLSYLKELDKQKPVIWCGDLNVAHNEIDIRNPDTNKKSAGFTKEERECFTKLLSEGFIDSFRFLNPDKQHAYTYWSYFNGARDKNIGWRLDYFVLSERLKPQLVDSTMRTAQKGSDHCPIVLLMKF